MSVARSGRPTKFGVRMPPVPRRLGTVMTVRPSASFPYHSRSALTEGFAYAPMFAISIPTERLFDVVACHARSLRSIVW